MMVLTCIDLNNCPPAFGSDDLGRAASICYVHQQVSRVMMNPASRIPAFQKDWEACEKVYAAWLDSEAARAIREREAEEERQRIFIHEFAATLK